MLAKRRRAIGRTGGYLAVWGALLSGYSIGNYSVGNATCQFKTKVPFTLSSGGNHSIWVYLLWVYSGFTFLTYYVGLSRELYSSRLLNCYLAFGSEPRVKLRMPAKRASEFYHTYFAARNLNFSLFNFKLIQLSCKKEDKAILHPM